VPGARLADEYPNLQLWFWHFQFIETGIFLALTAAALGATVWLLRRRTA
jgi:hypothetical protein